MIELEISSIQNSLESFHTQLTFMYGMLAGAVYTLIAIGLCSNLESFIWSIRNLPWYKQGWRCVPDPDNPGSFQIVRKIKRKKNKT